MPDKIIFNFLTALGLTSDESRIYVFLLQNGPASELDLSRKTKIARTTVYRVLENLMEKGLLQKNQSPGSELLEKLVKNKETEVANLRAQLPSILKLLDY